MFSLKAQINMYNKYYQQKLGRKPDAFISVRGYAGSFLAEDNQEVKYPAMYSLKTQSLTYTYLKRV